MTTLRKIRNDFFKTSIDFETIDLFLRGELKLSNTDLLLKFSDEIPNKTEEQLRSDFQQVVSGKPVQYVLGFANFYGRTFKVDSRVLVPEVETAELIDHVKDAVLLPLEKDFSILDVGTGSGNIAITLALELKAAKVLAVDISKKALGLAQENARRLSASSVQFVLSDLLDNVTGEFDLVVSNPPYIAQGANDVEASVLNYEPHQALFAGEDGLDIYRRLIPQMADHLKKDGYAIFEMDNQQGAAITKLIKASFPQAQPEIFQDMAGLNRFIAWRN